MDMHIYNLFKISLDLLLPPEFLATRSTMQFLNVDPCFARAPGRMNDLIHTVPVEGFIQGFVAVAGSWSQQRAKRVEEGEDCSQTV